MTRPRLSAIEARLWDAFTACPWGDHDRRSDHATEILVASGFTRADAITVATAAYAQWDAHTKPTEAN